MLPLKEIKKLIPQATYDAIVKDGITELRPSQSKAVHAGLLDGRSLLVCTPTASGKTLIAELAAAKAILENKGKAIYIAPLKALASEKYREFNKKYSGHFRTALAIGDMDSPDNRLAEYDLIICTSEKLDSLIRHHAYWLKQVSCVIIDEIHLLNDPGRGPTLEILITILKQLINDLQLIGLSATIGNEKELAEWLEAELVHDTWRPIVLKKGTYLDGEVLFD